MGDGVRHGSMRLLLLLPLPACLPLEGEDTMYSMDLRPGWRWVTDREASLDDHMSPRGA